MSAGSRSERTEVLVVGGGPVGLTMAGLLARCGVTSTVLERRTTGLRAPAAHVLRGRARAVLAQLGVDGDIEDATPPLPLRHITWCSTLGGVELGRLDLRDTRPGAGKPWTNISQSRLEPILVDAVSAMPQVSWCPGAQAVEVWQDGDSVCARVREDGRERIVEADWLVAADGAGSRTRDALGVDLVGEGPLGRFFMVHFAADLTPWVRDRPGPIFWIMNPEARGSLIVHDVERSHVFMTASSGVDGEVAALPERLAAALGVPLPVEILSIDTWTPYCQVASRYRAGRALLVGDAAHRFPPSGGLGLNTGIVEAHNLAWKLAMVQTGRAGPALLDTYESECRPAAERNARESLHNAMRLGLIDEAVGPCRDLAALHARLGSMGPADRASLDTAIEQQRSHFAADGAQPGPARPEGGAAPRYWAAPYGRFTLHAAGPSSWHGVAGDVTARTGVTVEVSRVEGDATTGLPPAFLTRPDGTVVWWSGPGTGDPRDGIGRAVDEVLASPAMLRWGPGS